MDQQNFLGSNIYNVKTHNMQAVLMCLLYERHLSRIQIAKKTSLSTTTITNLVSELLEHGIISETDSINQANQQRKVGRPQTALTLIPESRYAIGVHIGIGIFRIALVNLYAEIINKHTEEFSLNNRPEDVLYRISQSIESLITESGIDRDLILGAGIGASGLVNYQTGVNILAPNLGWNSVPIKELLENSISLSITVDNNVRAMAVGEAFFGKGRNVDSLAFVYGRIGVGAGLFFSGKVFRGSNTGAGEIGHMIIIPNGGEICRCGQTGCLETLVSEPVMVLAANNIIKESPEGLLNRIWNQDNGMKPIEKIFTAARKGDKSTIQILNRCASYLGIALANLINIFNPELIILGGIFAEGKDILLPMIDETMREKAFAGLGENVRLETTGFGWKAGVIGASSLALTRFFYQLSE